MTGNYGYILDTSWTVNLELLQSLTPGHRLLQWQEILHFLMSKLAVAPFQIRKH